MVNVVSWIALSISLILGIVKIVETIKYWKSPKIEIVLGFSNSELKTNGKDIFKIHLTIKLINSGNEDVFIRELLVYHKQSQGALLSIPIKRDFNLPARSTENFERNMGWLDYNPKKYGNSEMEEDNIYVVVKYGKNKQINKKLYFHMSKETKKISIFRIEN